MNLPVFIAKRYLFSKDKKSVIHLISLISMGGIGVGAMTLIIVLSAFNGINDLVETLYSSFDAEIRIEAVHAKTFEDTPGLRNTISSLQEISYLGKSLEETVLIKYKKSQTSAIIKGVDTGFIDRSGLADLMWSGEAKTQTPLGRNKLIIGYKIAEALGLFIGNTVKPLYIYAAKRNASNSVQMENAFYISAINASGIFAINQDIDRKYVVTNLPFVEELLQKKGQITAYEIRLNAGADVQAVKAELQHALGKEFEVETRQEQNELLFKTNNTEKWATFIILSFVLLIATFNVIGSLTMLILEKKQDVFVIRSMGGFNIEDTTDFLY